MAASSPCSPSGGCLCGAADVSRPAVVPRGFSISRVIVLVCDRNSMCGVSMVAYVNKLAFRDLRNPASVVGLQREAQRRGNEHL